MSFSANPSILAGENLCFMFEGMLTAKFLKEMKSCKSKKFLF